MGQGWVFFIIVGIAAIVHVVQLILQAVERKQKQERAAELARQRQQQGGMQADRPDTPVLNRSRLDELAARRQAQLDELRARRAGRQQTGQQQRQAQTRMGGAGGMGGAGTAAPPTQVRRGGQVQPAPTGLRVPNRDARQAGATTSRMPTRDPASARQIAQRQAREAIQRKLDEQARQTMQQEQRASQARQWVDREAAASRRKADELLEAASPYAIRLKREHGLIALMVNQPQMLRQAILMKEILDRPVSLRSQDEQPGHMPAG